MKHGRPSRKSIRVCYFNSIQHNTQQRDSLDLRNKENDFFKTSTRVTQRFTHNAVIPKRTLLSEIIWKWIFVMMTLCLWHSRHFRCAFCWAPFYSHGLTPIPTWISNYIHCKVWDEISYPFLKFNGAAVEVYEWVSNFIPHFAGQVITYPCWD